MKKINYGLLSLIYTAISIFFVKLSYVEDMEMQLSTLYLFSGMLLGLIGFMCTIYAFIIKEKGIYKFIGLIVIILVILSILSVPFINKYIIYK